MTTILSNCGSSFGMKCVQCSDELIAPKGPSTGAIGAPVMFGTVRNAAAVLSLSSCVLPQQFNEIYPIERR